MIGYITIGVVDIEQAKTFYDSVLGTIGWAAAGLWPELVCRLSARSHRQQARDRVPESGVTAIFAFCAAGWI